MACRRFSLLIGLLIAIAANVSGETPLEVTVTISKPQSVYHIGDPINVIATITNRTDELQTAVRDPQNHKQPLVCWSLRVYDIPSIKCDMITGTLGVTAGQGGPGTFFVLKPRQAVTTTAHSLTPMFPGTAVLSAQHDAYVQSPVPIIDGGKEVHVWRGSAFGKTVIEIAAEPSKEMAERHATLTAALLDETKPVKERRVALKQLSEERNYFAAEQIRLAWPKIKDPAVYDEVSRVLIELVKFGTAYRAWPDVIKLLGREDIPQQTRQMLLNVVRDIGPTRESCAYEIGGQADYAMPQPLLDELFKQLELLSKGRDPYLAAQAATILQHATQSTGASRRQK